MYVFIVLVKVTEWPPIGKIAAHSACGMFHGIVTSGRAEPQQTPSMDPPRVVYCAI